MENRITQLTKEPFIQNMTYKYYSWLFAYLIQFTLLCGCSDTNTNGVILKLPESVGYTEQTQPSGVTQFLHSPEREFHFLDVVPESGMAMTDTLLLERKDGTTVLSRSDNGILKKVVTIYPMFDAKYVTTEPQVERVYLEANGVQTSERSLRLIIRNTDTYPSYCFFDVIFNGEEIRVGLCGLYDLGEVTYADGKGGAQLCTAKYDRIIKRNWNGDRDLIPYEILDHFWKRGCGCECAI